MGFTGELEDISIVDVIQLLHATRKSGTLCVKGRKGESRIVFSDGYIVNANHLNNRVRIGSILVEMKAITPEALDEALEAQKRAGKNRKPLVATLIELGKVKKEDAHRGLRKLLEMTVVELVGWTRGTFTLDTDSIPVSDDCRYFPEKMDQEMSLDTQMVLMDALRVFDEQHHDQRPEEESEEVIEDQKRESDLSAEDLGLADIDQLKQRTPESFSGIEFSETAEMLQPKIKEMLSDFSAAEQDEFASFLEKLSGAAGVEEGSAGQPGLARVIILFSKDGLIKHSFKTVCKNEGILVMTSHDEEDLNKKIEQCLSLKIVPTLVIDRPEESSYGFPKEELLSLQQSQGEKYPQVSKIQLAARADHSFFLRSLQNGVRAVFPMPLKEEQKETFIDDTMQFLKTFQAYIKGFFDEQGQQLAQHASTADALISRLKSCVSELRGREETPDVLLVLHRFVSEMFERTVTFYVRETDIMGVRGTGIHADKSRGTTPAMRIKLPLTAASVLHDVVIEGRPFLGKCDDETISKDLFQQIGAPLHPTILLLPMKSRGEIVTITYADFGSHEPAPVAVDALEVIAGLAGLVLENAIYRKACYKRP